MELNKVTNIEVNWSHNTRSRSLCIATTGNKMPKKIKLMLLNKLLEEFGVNIEIRK